MHYIKTSDFDQFKCTAGDCPASCCIGWKIAIDEKSLFRYSQYEGGFGNFMKNSIDWKKGCFLQYDGRCALLNEENLCDLQIEKGEEALCNTCSEHPRHMEEYPGVREYSLDLSCPEVAKHYCEEIDSFEFLEFDDDQEDEEYEEFNSVLYSQLVIAREEIYSIIRNREDSLLCRMEKILLYANRLQNKYYENGSAENLTCSVDHSFFTVDESAFKMIYLDNMHKYFGFLFEVDPLTDEFAELLQETIDFWSDINEATFPSFTEEETRAGENMLLLLIYIYFCGAVYDEMIFSKAAMAVLLVQWMLGINRAVGDRYQGLSGVAYRVCREIEHGENNFERVEDCMDALPY